MYFDSGARYDNSNLRRFIPEIIVLSLTKDAFLAEKGAFRDPSLFTDPAGSTGDKLSVTRFAPKVRPVIVDPVARCCALWSLLQSVRLGSVFSAGRTSDAFHSLSLWLFA